MSRNKTDKGQFEAQKQELDGKYKEYLDWFENRLTKLLDTTNTITKRVRGARYFLAWCQTNGYDLPELEKEHIDKYIVNISDKADTTISGYIDSVSVLFLHLTDDIDYPDIQNDPTSRITYEYLDKKYDIRPSSEYKGKLRREGRESDIYPSYDRIEPIFDHMGTPELRNELIARLAWYTACRPIELTRLRIDGENMDRDKRMFRVESAKLNEDDHPDLINRRVYYSKDIDYLLDEYLREERRAIYADADESPYLFVGQATEQLSPAYVSRLIKEGAHRADEEGNYEFQIQEPISVDADGNVERWLITGHRIRFARINHLVNHTDMDITAVRRLAGHAQLERTLSYTETDWETVRKQFHKFA